MGTYIIGNSIVLVKRTSGTVALIVWGGDRNDKTQKCLRTLVYHN